MKNDHRSQSKRPEVVFSRPTAEERLDAVLRLATRLFNQRGIGGTTLDDLAAGLGIRKASLYNYVDNKHDLIYRCVMRTVSVRAAIMDVAEKVSGKTIDRLEAYLAEFVRVLWGPPQMYPLMAFWEYPEDYITTAKGKKTDRVVRRELDRLTALFEGGIEDGSVRPGDPMILIHAFESPFVSFTRWYRPDEHPPGAYIQEALNEFIIAGLRNPT